MQRSAAHKNKKPMIVVMGDVARRTLLEWYPVAAGAVAQSTRTISIEEEQAELWDLTTVKRQRTLTQSVIVNTSIVICAEPLAEKDKEILDQFKKSHIFYLTNNTKQDKNNLSDLIWLCGSGVDPDSLKTCDKQEIGNLKFLHKWLDESGFDCRSIAKVAKSDLFEAIKKIHSIENRAYLLLQCLNEETLLGKRFWTKDWDEFRELSLDKGLLKDICDELIRINPAYKGIIKEKLYLVSAKAWCDKADQLCQEQNQSETLWDMLAEKYCDYAALLDPVHATIYQQKKGTIYYLEALGYSKEEFSLCKNKYIKAINLGHKKAYEKMLEKFKKETWLQSQTTQELLEFINKLDEQYRIAFLLLCFDSSAAIYKIMTKGESPDITKGIYKVIYDCLIKINPNYALTINQYLENNANEIRYYEHQAKRHEDAGEIDKAIEIYKIILEKDKDNFDACRWLGLLYQEQKQYDESITYHTKALEHPAFHALSLENKANIYFCRGACFSRSNKNEEAIADFQESLRINNMYSKSYNGLAVRYMTMNDNELALEYVNEAIKILKSEKFKDNHIDLSTFYSNRGYIYHTLGELEKAENDSREAISLEKDNSLAYYNLGNILHAEGKLTEALNLFNRSLSLNGDGRVYYARALTHEALKNYELALNDYRCAISKKQKGAENNLGLLLQSNVLTRDVNADVILGAIELFDHQEQLALIISCFGPASLYIGKDDKLDLESKLGKQLSAVIESICNKTDANYNDEMSQLLGEDYQSVKARIEEKNKNKENDADQYMQFFNQVVCKETLSCWERKEEQKDAPIFKMYCIAQDSSKSNVQKRQEIMTLANKADQKIVLFRNEDVSHLYRKLKEEDTSNFKESRRYFAVTFYIRYADLLCQYHDDFKSSDKWLNLLNAIIQLHPCKKYYEERSEFLCRRYKNYDSYVAYEKSLNQASDAEVMTLAMVEDLMVKDLEKIESYETLAKLYEKSDPKKALEYYLKMKNQPILPMAKLYMQLDMYRDALYKYHHCYVVLRIKMNDDDLIFSFIKNLIAKDGFVEDQSDNDKLLYQPSDVRMIKELLDVCLPRKREAVMIYLQEHSSLLHKKLEEFEYVAKYQDQTEEKKESAVVQWSIFPAKDKNGNKNKSKSTDDNRPESSSSSSDYNL